MELDNNFLCFRKRVSLFLLLELTNISTLYNYSSTLERFVETKRSHTHIHLISFHLRFCLSNSFKGVEKKIAKIKEMILIKK